MASWSPSLFSKFNPHTTGMMRRATRILAACDAARARCLPRGLLLAGAVGILTLTAGCAYFNTMYNARKAYRAAEEVPRMPDGSINRAAYASYDDVIEKCEALIAQHPDSKWVDDAILMMGKAHYRKNELDKAITRFNELQKDHPESELLGEAQMYLAKTLVAKDDPNQAVPLLQAVFERNPKNKFTDEILFLLGTNLVRIDQEKKALHYLEILAETYPNSTFRVDADLEIADLYLERGAYEKSLAVFRKLSGVKLSTDNLIRFLTKLAEAQVKIGRYPAALRTFTRLERFVVKDAEKASQMLYKGRALVGLDSLAAGIEIFEAVAVTYPRSIFSAEASYRLGSVYQEKLDSLDVAKAKFDQVPRQYSKSSYAPEAIRRSVSITKLQKLRESLGKGGGEDKAGVQFDLSEVQLFQFSDYEKALEGYNVILDQYPNSEIAPKAAYAVAYIYESLLKDPARARAAYLVVVQSYPESQQAVYARRYLGLKIEHDAPAAPDSLDSASKGEEP